MNKHLDKAAPLALALLMIFLHACGAKDSPIDEMIRIKDSLCSAQSRGEIRTTHKAYEDLQRRHQEAGYEASSHELPELHIVHQQYQDCMREQLRLYEIKTPDNL